MIQMKLKDFKVGQTVWVYLMGTARKNKKEEEFIEEWEVTRVGKKYVYAKKKNTNSIEVAFSKLNYLPYHWIEKTNTLFFNYLLYGTREELEEYLEKDHLQQIISKFFQGCGGRTLSLLQLKQIEEIIDGSSK